MDFLQRGIECDLQVDEGVGKLELFLQKGKAARPAPAGSASCTSRRLYTPGRKAACASVSARGAASTFFSRLTSAVFDESICSASVMTSARAASRSCFCSSCRSLRRALQVGPLRPVPGARKQRVQLPLELNTERAVDLHPVGARKRVVVPGIVQRKDPLNIPERAGG